MGGVTFREVMSGQIMVGESDPAAAYKARGTSAIKMIATVTISDVTSFLRDPVHGADLVAELDLPRITGAAQLSEGQFGLFVPTADARTTHMRYELPVVVDGKLHVLRGVKIITPAPAWRLWRATSTLHTTLHDSDSADMIVAAGILRMGPIGFLAMLTTMRGTGTRRLARTRSLTRFLGFFVGGLVSTYILHRRA